MERPAKRMRMSTPHPVAELLDDAFRAYFLKVELRLHPVKPLRAFNALKQLKMLNKYVDSVATHSDGCLYAELPYNLQGLVRKFTPHPVSKMVKDAHFVARAEVL